MRMWAWQNLAEAPAAKTGRAPPQEIRDVYLTFRKMMAKV
jgi:hypothetical protein